MIYIKIKETGEYEIQGKMPDKIKCRPKTKILNAYRMYDGFELDYILNENKNIREVIKLVGSKGDYIVVDSKNRMHLCKKKDFKKKFEILDEEIKLLE